MSAVETVLRDLHFAVRLLRRAPLFTAAAVLTLAIAIAVNVAVFSVVDAVLLEPLPYPDPNRLAIVTLTQHTAEGPRTGTAQTGRTWEAIRDEASAFDRAAFSSWTSGVNMVAPGEGAHARYVTQQRVGAGFFSVLGVSPLLGREFTPDDDRPGGPAVCVISAPLWRRSFGADPAIVGQTLALRGQPFTIVGIMPDGFESGERADLWTPLRASRQGEGEGENYGVLVRLPAADAWPAAQADVARIGRDLSRQRRPASPEWSLSLVPLQSALTTGIRRPLLLLWAAVGIVWIVACVNLTGLLLTRAGARAREMSTRMALGSGRSRIIRQLCAESAVLAMLGGALGIWLGYAALEGLKYVARDAFDLWQPVALDSRAVGAAALLSAIACVVLGLAPALQVSRLDVHAGLVQGGSRSVAGRRAGWPRQALIVAQVAMAIVLLVGAGLLLRTFSHLSRLDPGFDDDDLVVASVSLEDARYRTNQEVTRLFDGALAEMERLPGVESAAVMLGLPYQRLLNLGFRKLDAADAPGTVASATYVSGDFLRAFGIPLRRGRSFDRRDTTAAAGVVIVNEAFARTHYPDLDPVGRRIAFAGREREIVGIVGDIQVRPGFGDHGPLAAMPLAYIPVSQASDGMLRLVHGWFSPAFVIRTPAGANRIASGLRRALDSVDPRLPFADVLDFDDVQAASLAPQRFAMSLGIGLAASALLLACIGLHGLIATSVAERTREMGIRLALGATPGRAIRTLAVPGVRLAAIGVAAGCLAALAAARLVAHFVWGIEATDPVTFGGVALAFLLVATGASVIPALRILRLDPATTLRSE
jgi:predicted permease